MNTRKKERARSEKIFNENEENKNKKTSRGDSKTEENQ